jgi:hypothetical protein
MNVTRLHRYATAFVLSIAMPVYADNCGSLSDCLFTILAALLVILLLALLIFLLWEFFFAAPLVGEGLLTAAEMGEIIGWGTGQTIEAVAQTEAVTGALTTEAVEGMIARGLTREFVENQLAMYVRSAANAVKVAKNAQLLPRLALMQRLLELWP